MTMYTPFTDDEPGQASTFNSRFAEIQAAIEARAGSFFTYQRPTILVESQPSITIPVTQINHSMLLLVLALRADTGVSSAHVLMRFNGIGGTGYGWQSAMLVGGAFTHNSGGGESDITVTSGAAGAGAAANNLVYSMVRIEASSQNSAKLVGYDVVSNTSGMRCIWGGGRSDVMEPITSILLSTSGNFVASSAYALYGM